MLVASSAGAGTATPRAWLGTWPGAWPDGSAVPTAMPWSCAVDPQSQDVPRERLSGANDMHGSRRLVGNGNGHDSGAQPRLSGQCGVVLVVVGGLVGAGSAGMFDALAELLRAQSLIFELDGGYGWT